MLDGLPACEVATCLGMCAAFRAFQQCCTCNTPGMPGRFGLLPLCQLQAEHVCRMKQTVLPQCVASQCNSHMLFMAVSFCLQEFICVEAALASSGPAEVAKGQSWTAQQVISAKSS